jgi:hypothetical protein
MPAVVTPHAELPLTVRLDTTELYGDYTGELRLAVDDPDHPELAATVSGRVVHSLEADPPLLAMATTPGRAAEASTVIESHDRDPIQIVGLESANPRLALSVVPLEPGRRWRLSARLDPDRADGKQMTPILVRSTSPRTPTLRIAAYTYVHDPVYTFPEAVDMGDLRRDDPALAGRISQTLMIYQAGGRDFGARLSTDLPFLRIGAERGPAGDRWEATIALVPDLAPDGPFRGTITVDTNDPVFRRLTVPVQGTIRAGSAQSAGD